MILRLPSSWPTVSSRSGRLPVLPPGRTSRSPTTPTTRTLGSTTLVLPVLLPGSGQLLVLVVLATTPPGRGRTTGLPCPSKTGSPGRQRQPSTAAGAPTTTTLSSGRGLLPHLLPHLRRPVAGAPTTTLRPVAGPTTISRPLAGATIRRRGLLLISLRPLATATTTLTLAGATTTIRRRGLLLISLRPLATATKTLTLAGATATIRRRGLLLVCRRCLLPHLRLRPLIQPQPPVPTSESGLSRGRGTRRLDLFLSLARRMTRKSGMPWVPLSVARTSRRRRRRASLQIPTSHGTGPSPSHQLQVPTSNVRCGLDLGLRMTGRSSGPWISPRVHSRSWPDVPCRPGSGSWITIFLVLTVKVYGGSGLPPLPTHGLQNRATETAWK